MLTNIEYHFRVMAKKRAVEMERKKLMKYKRLGLLRMQERGWYFDSALPSNKVITISIRNERTSWRLR